MSKKLKQGRFCCNLDDAELGAGIGEFYPAPHEDITQVLECTHQNYQYAAIKCEYGGMCVFQREVTVSMINEHPSLFEFDKELY